MTISDAVSVVSLDALERVRGGWIERTDGLVKRCQTGENLVRSAGRLYLVEPAGLLRSQQLVAEDADLDKLCP